MNIDYFFKKFKLYSVVYFTSTTIVFLLFINSEKDSIHQLINYDYLKSFIYILLRNTLSFIWITYSILIGKTLIYSYLIINGATLGLLISKFSNFKYLIIIIPHGILEIFTFIFCCVFVDLYIDKNISIGFLKKSMVILYILIIFAALIESILTPVLVNHFLF